MQRLTDAEREHALAALPCLERATSRWRAASMPLPPASRQRHDRQRAQAATCARWQKLAQDSAKPRHGALGVHVCQNKATPHKRRKNHFLQINKQKNKLIWATRISNNFYIEL